MQLDEKTRDVLIYRIFSELTYAQISTLLKINESSAKVIAGGYLSLAKRIRRAKWYWRLCIGFLLGCIIFLSLMYADGNRFDPISAAHAGNVIDKNSRLLAAVSMGKERILYIYDDSGLYRDIDVIYHFPF